MLRSAFQRAVCAAGSRLTAPFAARALAAEAKANGVPVEVCRTPCNAFCAPCADKPKPLMPITLCLTHQPERVHTSIRTHSRMLTCSTFSTQFDTAWDHTQPVRSQSALATLWHGKCAMSWVPDETCTRTAVSQTGHMHTSSAGTQRRGQQARGSDQDAARRAMARHPDQRRLPRRSVHTPRHNPFSRHHQQAHR